MLLVYLSRVTFCLLSPTRCQGLAAAYDCFTPWTSLYRCARVNTIIVGIVYLGQMMVFRVHSCVNVLYSPQSSRRYSRDGIPELGIRLSS